MLGHRNKTKWVKWGIPVLWGIYSYWQWIDTANRNIFPGVRGMPGLFKEQKGGQSAWSGVKEGGNSSKWG